MTITQVHMPITYVTLKTSSFSSNDVVIPRQCYPAKHPLTHLLNQLCELQQVPVSCLCCCLNLGNALVTSCCCRGQVEHDVASQVPVRFLDGRVQQLLWLCLPWHPCRPQHRCQPHLYRPHAFLNRPAPARHHIPVSPAKLRVRNNPSGAQADDMPVANCHQPVFGMGSALAAAVAAAASAAAAAGVAWRPRAPGTPRGAPAPAPAAAAAVADTAGSSAAVVSCPSVSCRLVLPPPITERYITAAMLLLQYRCCCCYQNYTKLSLLPELWVSHRLPAYWASPGVSFCSQKSTPQTPEDPAVQIRSLNRQHMPDTRHGSHSKP